jgi:hypothetical protein
MPTNSESLNNDLYRLLSKYKPKPLDAEGKITPVPDEADVIKFEFTKDGEEYGTVYASIDEDRVLNVYFGDDVANSPDEKTPGVDYDDSWWGLYQQLSAWRMTKGLRGFKTHNKDRINDDMARRKHMRNKDKIAEGYYPMGKSRSYSDAVPSVKIVIEHSRVIEEGEQRYRNINRIFLENQDGERYLLDTKKPGIARVYARHIAEGGKVNDDRWNHVHSLCEEYSKMAGFVRATRNGQFNESAQSLVNEGIAHYQSLRESLSRMTGKRGYNAYFESWTPPLMEDGTEENNLNELFVQETLDPRIESVMPILNRIHKKVAESIVDKEMNKLAEWADSLTEEESLTSNNSVGIPESEGGIDAILAQHPKAVEIFRKGGDMDYDLKSDLWDYYFNQGDIRNYDADASEYIGQQLADHLGIDESALQAYLGDKKYGEKGMDALRKAGREHAGKEKMQSIRAKFSNKEDPVTEVDTGQYDAAKSPHKGETTPEQEKEFSNKVQAYSDELEQRQKEKGLEEGSHEDQVSRLAAYNEKMAGENPPIELGLREVGNWAKVGHYGNPIKTAWYNIAKYGIRNNKFNDSVDKAMSAIGDFPDKYDLSIPELDALYSAYETVYDQWEQSRGQQGVTEEQLNEFAPLLAAGARLFMAAAPKIAQVVGKAGQAGARGAGQAAKAGTEIAAKNAGQIGIGAGAYEIGSSVADIAKDITAKVGTALDEKTLLDLAALAFKYAIPAGIVLAILYGGKKAVDSLFADPKTQQGAANENFINQADQAVTSEGEHTQHAMRGRNPGANEFEHDFEPEDKIGNIHDKISRMLKRLEKPKHEPNMKDTDLGSTVLDEAAPWEDEDEEDKDKKPTDKKGSDGADHDGHSRAKHLAKQAIPKEKEEVKEGQDDLDRILTIMNHRR